MILSFKAVFHIILMLFSELLTKNPPSRTSKIPEIIENPPLLMQLQHHRNLNAKINMANDNKSKGMLLLIRLSHLYMLLF